MATPDLRSSAAFLLALLVCASTSFALSSVTVESGGTIEHAWWQDLDGNGGLDLLLLVKDGDGHQTLRVHRAPRGGRIGGTPDRVIDLATLPGAAGAILLAVADLTPAPGLEIALAGPHLLHLLEYVDGALGAPRQMAGGLGLAFDRRDDAGIRVWPHAFRPGPTERDALLLPTRDGYALLRFGEDGVARASRISAPPVRSLTVGSHDLFTVNTETPTPCPVDYDGDGKVDLLMVTEGRLAGHLQSRSGNFPRKPTFSFPMSFLMEGRGSSERDTFVRYLVDLEDVDGDGRADLLVTRTRGKIELFASFESQHFFYRGPSFYSQERHDLVSPPTGLIRVGGVSANPTLVDLDGDGHKDLVLTAIKADVVGQHLLKRVSAEYRMYRFDPRGGTFEKSPYFSLSRLYPVSRLESGDTGPTVFFTGDFDGDGLNDLLDIAAGGEDYIEIRKGRKAGGVRSTGELAFDRTVFRQRGEVNSDVRILDADGDGADDFMLRTDGTVFVHYTGKE